MKEKNNKIIEIKDVINFDCKIKKIDDPTKEYKFKDKTITLGENEILEDFDKNIIGVDLSESKVFSFEIEIPNKVNIFDQEIEEGSYIFGFKINKLQKFESREEIDMSSLKKVHDDKQEIEKLKEINNNLSEKIAKLELEKQLSEQTFKTKIDEMSKSATSKVEKIREEIKLKAKEDVEHKTKFALQKLMEDLLNPLNNLSSVVNSGAKSNDANVAAYVKGFQMLTNQIFNILETYGISIIEPKEGEEFNAEIHHIQELEENSNFKKDQIIKIVSKGYKLHERVLKPAIVIVAK